MCYVAIANRFTSHLLQHFSFCMHAHGHAHTQACTPLIASHNYISAITTYASVHTLDRETSVFELPARVRKLVCDESFGGLEQPLADAV